MATVPSPSQPDSFWNRTFDPDTRRQLLKEDSEAQTAVALILMAIVSIGTLLALVSLFFAVG